MSSELQSDLSAIQQVNYVSIVVVTAIGYDFVLSFSKEIEYIWARPWTWVSTLYVLVRYFGIYCAMSALVGSSFIPGPAKSFDQLIPINSCYILTAVGEWALLLFVGAADLIMILRLYAMYNRSRILLGALLLIYIPNMALTLIICILYKGGSQTVGQLLNFSFCVTEPSMLRWTEANAIIELILSVTFCALALIQFMLQSVRMYSATKRWQLNKYVNMIVSEGLLYFISLLLYILINLIGNMGLIPAVGWSPMVLFLVAYIPVFTMTPRFVLNMRELYSRDLHGSGGDVGLDSGFGLSSVRNHRAGVMSVLSVIAFAEAGPIEEVGDEEVIAMELRSTINEA